MKTDGEKLKAIYGSCHPLDAAPSASIKVTEGD